MYIYKCLYVCVHLDAFPLYITTNNCDVDKFKIYIFVKPSTTIDHDILREFETMASILCL